MTQHIKSFKATKEQEALNIIKQDLFACKTTLELGEKYKKYKDELDAILLASLNKMCKEENND